MGKRDPFFFLDPPPFHSQGKLGVSDTFFPSGGGGRGWLLYQFKRRFSWLAENGNRHLIWALIPTMDFSSGDSNHSIINEQFKRERIRQQDPHKSTHLKQSVTMAPVQAYRGGGGQSRSLASSRIVNSHPHGASRSPLTADGFIFLLASAQPFFS